MVLCRILCSTDLACQWRGLGKRGPLSFTLLDQQCAATCLFCDRQLPLFGMRFAQRLRGHLCVRVGVQAVLLNQSDWAAPLIYHWYCSVCCWE